MTPNSDKPINSEEIRCKWCNLPLEKSEGYPYTGVWIHFDSGRQACTVKHTDAEPINSVSPASTKENP